MSTDPTSEEPPAAERSLAQTILLAFLALWIAGIGLFYFVRIAFEFYRASR